MKIKIFTDCGYLTLENEVNKWLDDNCMVNIKFILQSQNQYSYTISIFYEEII